MGHVVTLELPEAVAGRAQEIANRAHRRLEDMLVEWIDRTASEPPIEMLSNEQLLALCDMQMEETQQRELSDLLADQREGLLDALHRQRLDELLAVYRRGWVRKAQALKVAVERRLRPALN